MPKIKSERVAGIVALSYLVLIPAGAFYAWMKVQALDQDIDDLWSENKELPARRAGFTLFDLQKLKRAFRGDREV